MRKRLAHGFFWGMVAAPVAALIPLLAMAFGIWPAPSPITSTFWGRVFGWGPHSPPAYVLAALWQLLYGGFWGVFIAYATGPLSPQQLARPGDVLQGLGAGLLRALLANLSAVLYLDWGAFGVLASPWIPLGILISDLAFGATAGWLLYREDYGRLRLPFPRLQPRPA